MPETYPSVWNSAPPPKRYDPQAVEDLALAVAEIVSELRDKGNTVRARRLQGLLDRVKQSASPPSTPR